MQRYRWDRPLHHRDQEHHQRGHRCHDQDHVPRDEPNNTGFLEVLTNQLYLELGIFRHFANINVEASNFLAFNFFPTMIESLAAMNNSWNLLIQECYHDFSDHASQHRKGDIHQT